MCAYQTRWRVYEAKKYNQAPDGFNTLKAVGKYVPDIGGQRLLGRYCKVPCGLTVVHREASARTKMLRCNEYIVFDQDRIRIKFIVHCERDSLSSYLAPAVQSSVTLQRPLSLTPVGLALRSPRPVNPRPIAIYQSNATRISSTIRLNSTGLMYRNRYNVPSSKPSANLETNSDLFYAVLSYCSKSDYFWMVCLFLVILLASYTSSSST